MKKTFRAAALALALAGTGVGLTSCGSESLPIILTIIQQIMQGNQTQYNSVTCQTTYYVETGNGMKQVPGKSNTNVTAQVSKSFTNTITLSFGPLQVNDSVSVSNLTISNLIYNTDANQTSMTLDLGTNSSILGTIKVGNQTYEASNLFIDSAKKNAVISMGGFSFDGDIYFGNDDRAINLKYTGKAVENQGYSQR